MTQVATRSCRNCKHSKHAGSYSLDLICTQPITPATVDPQYKGICATHTQPHAWNDERCKYLAENCAVFETEKWKWEP